MTTTTPCYPHGGRRFRTHLTASPRAARLLLFIASLSLVVLSPARAQLKPMDEFVDDLLSQMTVEEKIGQLNLLTGNDVIPTGISEPVPVEKLIAEGSVGAMYNSGGVKRIEALQRIAVEQTRLGIPLLFGMDVIHGYETVFPLPVGMSCTWDLEGVEQSARIAAIEASADGIAWTYSPMVDIALDARWGRIAEGAGEDPYLGSLVAAAMVRGYQGDLTRPDEIMACVKHFALYGAAEAGRDYNTVDMSRTRMYNQYLPPYKAAVEAGAGSVMTSFNVIDYVPATANEWLLQDLLRGEWGFRGFVVTDYGSIVEMTNHGLGDMQHSAVRALKAGTDMDMCAQAFSGTLAASLSEGLVSEDDINRACRRVLEAKYKLGLFEDPYRYCDAERGQRVIYCNEHRAVARQLTARSLVLLKNEADLLPLQKSGTIALIGPLADTQYNVPGTWSVAAKYEKYTTLREAMEHALEGRATLLYAQGCNICSDSVLQADGAYYRDIPRINDEQALREALSVAEQADVIVCAMGEEGEMSGESASRADLTLFDVQHRLLEALTATGKPIVMLNYSGRPTVLTWENEHLQAIVQVWFGSESGDAVCDVLFGDASPYGRLTTSFPRLTGQEPLYYNHLPTGRPMAEGATGFKRFSSNYLDVRNDPLFAFGYGLTYTTFTYSDISLSSDVMPADGELTATVTVTNTGQRAATELVQLYIRDPAARISRPVKELKDFRRISLEPGESRDVSFTLTTRQLSYYDNHLNYGCDPGEFIVMIGPDSRDISLHTARFELTE